MLSKFGWPATFLLFALNCSLARGEFRRYPRPTQEPQGRYVCVPEGDPMPICYYTGPLRRVPRPGPGSKLPPKRVEPVHSCSDLIDANENAACLSRWVGKHRAD